MSAESRISRDVADQQVKMFAMFVGRGLFVTRATLSAATDVPESSLREYAKGAAIPLHVVLALRRALPAAAINMLCEPGDARMVTAEEGEACWNGVAAASARLTSAVLLATADGHIDHREKADLKNLGRDLAAHLAAAVEGG